MSFRTFALLAALLLATQSIFAANITARDWGTTSKGEKVQLFTLKTGVRHGLVVEISNFGGVVVRLMAPDREGVLRDVVLGYDSFPEYEKGGVYSALIGPYANRLVPKFQAERPDHHPAGPGPARRRPRRSDSSFRRHRISETGVGRGDA